MFPMLETYKQHPQEQIVTPAESSPAQLTLGLLSWGVWEVGARCHMPVARKLCAKTVSAEKMARNVEHLLIPF